MLSAMRSKGSFGRVLGLCAVLALQMLLSGILATEMEVAGTVFGSEICYGDHAPDPDGPANQKTRHDACAICAFASLPPPVPVAASFAVPVVYAAAPASLRAAQTVPPSNVRHHPRLSRGPPQNV